MKDCVSNDVHNGVNFEIVGVRYRIYTENDVNVATLYCRGSGVEIR